MRIDRRDIHRIRQNLGQEPPEPSSGPNSGVYNAIDTEIDTMAEKSEEATHTISDEKRRRTRTNYRNQYR